MADSPPFTWSPPPLVQGQGGDGGYTRSESALYAQIRLGSSAPASTTGGPTNRQAIGLAQSIRCEGQTGNTPVNGIGEAASENKPGQMYFTLTCQNFSIRTRRLVDMALQIYPSVVKAGQVDFRTLPFELDIDNSMKSGSGATKFDETFERWCGCWIQSWSSEYQDPNSLRLESVTLWASGWMLVRGGKPISMMGNIPSATIADTTGKNTG